jgi:4-hydroxybenzoate polyprenyltransferase
MTISLTDVNLFSPSFLFASLIWGSIGVGYFVYGKKQQSLPAMVGGIVMIAVSYFVGSALGMSLICVLVIVAVYMLLKRGY